LEILIERRGQKPSGRGQGSASCRGRRRDARRPLGSPPPTRSTQCCTPLLGLPRVDDSFEGTIGDWDRATRSKAERKGSRVVFVSRNRPHAERLAHHLQRDPLGAARDVWDYRWWIPVSKGLLEIRIERHGRSKAERKGSRVVFVSRAAPACWITTFNGAPLGTVRNFWYIQVLMPPSNVLLEIGIERRGPKASGTGRGTPIFRRRCRPHAERFFHHRQRDPIGTVRNLRDY
jgi:hypothetical protein